MARLALLPEFNLPRSLDDLRAALLADDAVDECSVVVHTSRTVDPAVYNTELADQLRALGPLDLIVAVGSTADAAVAGRGAAKVLLIDPPLLHLTRPLEPFGSKPGLLAVSPDHAEGFETIMGDALEEARASDDPFARRMIDEVAAWIRSRLPFEEVEVDPVPALQWVLDARDADDYLSIWLTQPFCEDSEKSLRFASSPERDELQPGQGTFTFTSLEALVREEPPPWFRRVDWPRFWWWAAPRTGADAIAELLHT